MSATMSELVDQARQWIDGDPDPTTRAELTALIESGDHTELADRMDGGLDFGTAGLRGLMGAGSNRMNRATVIRTTRGLADYLVDRYGGVPENPVMVGRDARVGSSVFMGDVVGVLLGAGLSVKVWEEVVPTPLLAYAVTASGACAGVMITASHNPPLYNGYKVFDHNGAQIIPPVDTAIAEAIDRVAPAITVPYHHPSADLMADPIPPQVLDDYRNRLSRLRTPLETDPDQGIVYTPLHGVGWRYIKDLFAEAGYRNVHPVEPQIEPDGRFPTLPFPNPEEPGAMDLAIARAEETDADLVLANDPDADRLGVAVPSASGWVRLTGNQIGVLLIDHLLSRSDLPSHPPPLIVSTIVSSPLAERVAHAHGARFETTLTGFKWIMKAALDVESAGQGTFVFGFEEALGYAIGGLNRDKDGLSAALLMADLSSEARREGQTILDRLESIYRRHGLWVSVQNSIVRPGPEGAVEIESAMTYLGNHPPDSLGEKKVGSVTDYRKGADSRPAWLGATNLIALELPGGGRMLARPSGTEPKLKIYMDATRPLAIADDPARIESVMVREAETAVSELVDHIGL